MSFREGDLLPLLDQLKRARALITIKANWTQGCWARTSVGRDAFAFDKEAVCFCATGALARVRNGAFPSVESVTALWLAVDESPSVYNDNHTHEEVLAMFDKAIAAEEARLANA